jgi:hypothetical protein
MTYLRIPNPIAYGTCIGVCLSLAEQGEDPVEFIGDGQGGTVFGKYGRNRYGASLENSALSAIRALFWGLYVL